MQSDTIQYPDHTVSAPSLVNYDYTGPFLNRVYDATSGYNFAQYSNYNALGQPVSIAYGNGVTTYFTYEANTFRTKSLQTSKGGTTFQNLEYVYDPADNVSTITDYLTSANTQTFTYDGLNRLTSVAATSYGPLSYTYNEIGNLTSNSALTPSAYTYPASGSSSVRPHAVTTAGSNSYSYDANGNMLTGAGRTFNSYNVENRPTSITSGGQTTTFTYDGDGGRVKKQTGSSVTWYISKLYECDATTCQKYIWSGSQRIAVKQVSNSQIHFYHGDHLGSTNVVTDGAGVEVQRVNYTPFGEVRDNPIPTIAYKYTGKERDSATGLYWYEWRSYDPLLARFTSPDTLVGNPKDPQDLDRYGYARNNPLRYTDPTGHIADWVVYAIVATAFVAGGVTAGIQSDWNLKAVVLGAVISGASAAAGSAAGIYVGSTLGGGALAGGIIGGIAGGLTAATLNQLAGNKANWGPSIAYGGVAGGVAAGVGAGVSTFSDSQALQAIAGAVAAGVTRAGLGGGNIIQAALISASVATVTGLLIEYGASPAEAQAAAQTKQLEKATEVDMAERGTDGTLTLNRQGTITVAMDFREELINQLKHMFPQLTKEVEVLSKFVDDFTLEKIVAEVGAQNAARAATIHSIIRGTGMATAPLLDALFPESLNDMDEVQKIRER